MLKDGNGMLADELGVESMVGYTVVQKMSQNLIKMINGAR